jgi:S-adenosylmethionine:tRNA ribosyltransferase-isomerase
MHTSDFDYPLPPSLIAQTPSAARGDSRLLVVERGGPGLADRWFRDLPDLIPAGDLLVVNSTRVRRARLCGTRPGGGAAEVLLIHPGPEGTWVAMGKPGSALRPGKRIALGSGIEIETVTVLEGPNRVVRFLGGSAEEAIERFGRLPLPPYITRDPEPVDLERYQTVYAARESSVASPTAGLHFTQATLERLARNRVQVESLELEVGPGTFRPVETEDPRSHPMHPERFTIPDRLSAGIERTRGAGGKVWAVGTTVVRALESAADRSGRLAAGPGSTSLLILPGYRFKLVDRLITNFHLPRSTLLMLVSAFAGRETILAAYRHAVALEYRFYSYGDAMAIL